MIQICFYILKSINTNYVKIINRNMNYRFIKLKETDLSHLENSNLEFLTKSSCKFLDSIIDEFNIDKIPFINIKLLRNNNLDFDDFTFSKFKDDYQLYAINLNQSEDIKIVDRILNLLKNLDICLFILYSNLNFERDYCLDRYINKEYKCENKLLRCFNFVASCSLNQEIEMNKQSFSDYLFNLIDEKKMNEIDVYKNANIDRKLFSKMRNRDYIPSKKTVFSLCISLKLDLKESEKLLNNAGYSFSPSRIDDIIVKYNIEHKNYDLFSLNEQLISYNQTPLS